MARTWIDQHGVKRVLSQKRIDEQDFALGQLMYAFMPRVYLPPGNVASDFIWSVGRQVEKDSDDTFERSIARAFWSWQYDVHRQDALHRGSWHEASVLRKLEFLPQHNAQLLSVFREHYPQVYEEEMRRAIRYVVRAYFVRLRALYRSLQADLFMEL